MDQLGMIRQLLGHGVAEVHFLRIREHVGFMG